MKMIAEHIHGHIQEGQKKDYSVFFVPRRTMICERVLEEEGVYGDILILVQFECFSLNLDTDHIWRISFGPHTIR
jgi:hypothetical protein